MLFNVGAFNEKGNMIAGSLFILFKNRITFILNANNSESLENGSTHLLMDAAIRKFSQKNFIIDFEGSDVESFARFYEQYGAEKEMYGYYRHNTLPQPLRWIKDTIKF